jgi:hypothetical protein
MITEAKKDIFIFDLIKDTLNIFFSNMLYLIKIWLGSLFICLVIPTIYLSVIVSLFNVYVVSKSNWIDAISNLAGDNSKLIILLVIMAILAFIILISFILFNGIIVSLVGGLIENNRKMNFGYLVKKSFSKLLNIFVIFIGLIIFFLISAKIYYIPFALAIIFSFFTSYLIIVKNYGLINAIKNSFTLSINKWFDIVLIYLIAIGIWFLFAWIPYVGIFLAGFIIIFVNIFANLLYNSAVSLE